MGNPASLDLARNRPARQEAEVLAALQAAAQERILILDGAMGTQIQGLGFDEHHFRGDKFGGCACHQQGNNDLLILSQPKAIEEIHYQYAIAGADIIETNTFSSTLHCPGRLRHGGSWSTS